MSAEYHRYIASDKWKKIARFIRHDRAWMCQDCGDPGWICHHMVYEGVLYQEEKHLFDGTIRLLCDTCHKKRHGLLPDQRKNLKT